MDISSAILDPELGCVAFTVERGNEKDRPSGPAGVKYIFRYSFTQ